MQVKIIIFYKFKVHILQVQATKDWTWHIPGQTKLNIQANMHRVTGHHV